MFSMSLRREPRFLDRIVREWRRAHPVPADRALPPLAVLQPMVEGVQVRAIRTGRRFVDRAEEAIATASRRVYTGEAMKCASCLR